LAVIVEHQGARRLLIGSGWAYTEGEIFSGLKTHLDLGEAPVGIVALSDADGKLYWADSREIRVIEIDGQRPDQLLAPRAPYR
jgi:hypothetical protein